MARHRITVTLPRAEIMNKDAVIRVRGNNSIIGTLTISRGSIEWYSNHWKKPTRMRWNRFDDLMYRVWPKGKLPKRR